MKKFLSILIIALLFLTACQKKPVYSSYQMIRHQEWNMDNILWFDIPTPDTTNHYDIILSIRHTNRYRYQNLWLFTELNGKADTIEFYLADEFGLWLGNGVGDTKEMPVLYMTDYQFPPDSLITIKIQQGMRDSLLQGIQDVGVIVMRNEK
ncbi:MAG: gliding motility lipoprotein GldH [Paludibacteraceae bacterium]|nr:gliding motility lipoprotein GldH [Paludibacteraceae bacterium]